MRWWLSFVALACVVVVGSGCGSVVGCDFRGGEGGSDRCQERSGPSPEVFASSCESAGGVVIEGGCPREGVVAGCRVEPSDSTSVTDWYYPPETRASVEARCDDDQGEVIDP